jgi:hypothetical protein
MRREVDTLRGGEDVRRIREERNRLRGVRSWTPEEQADERSRPRYFQPVGSPVQTSAPPVATPTPPATVDTAKVNAELQGVAATVAATRTGFESLNQEVSALGIALEAFKAQLQYPPTIYGPAGGALLGVSPGFALGGK